MKKKISILCLILTALLVFGGCAGEATTKKPAEIDQDPNIGTPMPTITPDVESIQSGADADLDPGVEVSDEQLIKAAGFYQGQVDNNFIEIKIEGEPEETAYMVFMITDPIREVFEELDLQKDDAVVIEYNKNSTDQFIIKSLVMKAAGIYQGQADNNFIEIKIDGLPRETAYMVFMITDSIREVFKELDLQKGDAVIIEYFRNSSGQLALESLQKALK